MSLRLRSSLLAAAGGATFGLCWLPLGLAPFIPISFLLLLRGLRLVRTHRDAVCVGIAFGASKYVVGSHFLLALVRYSPLGAVFYPLAIAYILPYSIVESWGAFWLEKRGGLPRSFGLALLFTLSEKVRALGDLSFPADLLAHAFGKDPAWLALSPWIGPFGLTLLAFAVAIVLDRALEHRRRPLLAGAVAAAALAVWLVPVAVDRSSTGAREATGSLRVGIVQPAIRLEDKLTPERWPSSWERLDELTGEASRGADLVVWPETTRPGRVIWDGSGPFVDRRMEALAARHGVPILYGCEIARTEGGMVTALYNGAALVRPNGASEWYGKQRLLPFAEGVPFRGLLGWGPSRKSPTDGTRTYLTLVGNFSPGPKATIFNVGPARIGVLICYEGLYSGLARRYREEGANTLCVITNDAWWGRSLFAPWHARMIASRAREEDLPVLRAANSGVSSVTDRRGRMEQATRLFETTTLEVELHPGPPRGTFYTRHGDLVIVAALIVIGVAAARAVRGGVATIVRRSRALPA